MTTLHPGNIATIPNNSSSSDIIESMNYHNPKHAKPAPPFRETTAFKTVALTAATPVAVGLVATGGAVATYYHHASVGWP